jgi:hypothetical protein
MPCCAIQILKKLHPIDPMYGYQTGSKCPVLHANQDQMYPIQCIDAHYSYGCYVPWTLLPANPF